MKEWRDYFDTLHNGAILADLTSRAVHFWSEDESVYRLYPSSVPLNEELTRAGPDHRDPEGGKPGLDSHPGRVEAPSRLAPPGRGRFAWKPAGRAGALPWLARLSHPWHA